MAVNHEHTEHLVKMLGKDSEDPKAFSLDEKWSAVTRIFRYSKDSNETKWEYYKQLCVLDESDESAKRKVMFEAILVSDEDRQALYNTFLDKDNK